jgi:outer membrane lipoprotein SlyB
MRTIGSHSVLALCFALLVAISGCATNPDVAVVGEEPVRYGTIVQIEPVELEGDHQLGLGAILGAAAGGLLGSHIGFGFGRDVATVAGAIGGGYAGNAVQNRYADKRAGQQITVRLGNGVLVAVTQPADPNLRIGDRVRIAGAGESARAVRA